MVWEREVNVRGPAGPSGGIDPNDPEMVRAVEEAVEEALRDSDDLIVFHDNPGAPHYADIDPLAAMFRDRAFRSPLSLVKGGGVKIGAMQETVSQGYAGLAMVYRDRTYRSPLAIGMDARLMGNFSGEGSTPGDGGSGAATGVYVFGDSLARGLTGPITALPQALTVRGGGVTSQGAAGIAARQGGAPATVKLGVSSVAPGATVAVTEISTRVYMDYQGGTASGIGHLAGMYGELINDGSNNFTFHRLGGSGEGWMPPSGAAWVPIEAHERRGDAFIYWAGRNDPNSSTTSNINLIRDMVNHQKDPHRFLVLEIPPWSEEKLGTAARTALDARNKAIREAFGEHFVPAAQFYRGPALTAAGITPTAADQAAIDDGVTPPSLLSSSDHPTSAANQALARYIFDNYWGILTS